MYFKYQNKMENILVHLPVLYLNELYLEHIVQSYNAANYTDDNYFFIRKPFQYSKLNALRTKLSTNAVKK